MNRSNLFSCFALAVAVGMGGQVQAATLTYTPDSLPEIQVLGTTILSGTTNSSTGINPLVFGTSTITDSTVETPNVMRILTSSGTTGFVLFNHTITGGLFAPALQGAITGIDFAIDVRDPAVGTTDDTPILFGLTQGGNTYLYTEDTGTNAQLFEFRNQGSGTTSTMFKSFDKNGLLASKFALYGTSNNVLRGNSTSNPDFSASGAPIQLVFTTFINGGAGPKQRNTDFRNAEIILNYVPEPASLSLLALGGLAMLRRRR